MRALLLGVLLLAACPRPIPPPPYRAAMDAGDACPADVAVTQDELCANAFTPDARACAACSGSVPEGGCMLPGPRVFCVRACFDPICGVRAGGGR